MGVHLDLLELTYRMKRLLSSPWTYRINRVTGSVLLIAYCVLSDDWRLSLPWMLAPMGILAVIAVVVVQLRLQERFPRLHAYLLYPRGEGVQAQSDEEYRRLYEEYRRADDAYMQRRGERMVASARGMAILGAVAEDGLICVPLLLVGINPLSALVAGAVFGGLHMGTFTYLECIAKAVGYALICYFVLPHGLLTVAAGHLFMDMVFFCALRLALYCKANFSN